MPGKLVHFDQETWNALDLLAMDSMRDFQEWPKRPSPIFYASTAGRPQAGIAAECRRDREAAGGAIDPAPRRFEEGPQGRVRAIMGVRTRGLDIKASVKRGAGDKASRADAKAVVDRWNEQIAAGRDMLWSPTIRAALLSGTPWLDVFCPGCRTSRAIDLRTLDRLASVGTLVLGLRCSWCPGSAPMPKLLGLFTLPPARWADAAAL